MFGFAFWNLDQSILVPEILSCTSLMSIICLSSSEPHIPLKKTNKKQAEMNPSARRVFSGVQKRLLPTEWDYEKERVAHSSTGTRTSVVGSAGVFPPHIRGGSLQQSLTCNRKTIKRRRCRPPPPHTHTQKKNYRCRKLTFVAKT